MISIGQYVYEQGQLQVRIRSKPKTITSQLYFGINTGFVKLCNHRVVYRTD